MTTPLYEFDQELRQKLIEMDLLTKYQGEVRGPISGSVGDVYLINQKYGPRLAAKCPSIKRFGTRENARAGMEKVLYELEKAHKLFKVPRINTFFEVQFIYGWPFIWSRFRDGTLEDLIANPLNWSMQDRLLSLALTARALRLAQSFGVSAHQDIKPANIFFDDWSSRGVPKDKTSLRFQILVADFGIADAFRDLGRNTGSRPYMAPEQFASDPIDPTATPTFDIFALGVIAFECFSDGVHPIGVTTSDVWPEREGTARKWKRKETWRNWASLPQKDLPKTDPELPEELKELIISAISVHLAKRPSLQQFEDGLWGFLKRLDFRTYEGAQIQIQDWERYITIEDKWPHMDDRLTELREFYSDN